jgi:1-acyl-sn-glycerol-3-phosphate acyltransferase
MIYNISTLIINILAKILFRIKVYGRENIPKKGGVILASNHLSYLDPGIVGVGAWPRKVNFMARDSLFSVPILSGWMKAVGVIPVKRKSADLSALKQALRFGRSGHCLGLFPEGERQLPGSLGDAQAGVGFLASRLGVPVIPVFIKGSDKCLPRGSKLLRLKKISVFYGKQIPIEGGSSYYDIAQGIMAHIRSLGEESN